MTRIVLSREVISAVLGRPCPTCEGDTDAEDHPCAKTQRPIKPCRADLWNAHPRFDGPHDWHFFHYGPNDRYTGSCTGSGDGSHCNCSMTQDVCHWCGLEWLGDGEVRCPDCSGGVLPPTSEWIVVGGEPWVHLDWPHPGKRESEVRPPADLVEAAHSGERVDLAVPQEPWRLGGRSDGLVVLGTALVGKVLPIHGQHDDRYDLEPSVEVLDDGEVRYHDGDGSTDVTAQFASYDLTTLPGQYAVRITDARPAD